MHRPTCRSCVLVAWMLVWAAASPAAAQHLGDFEQVAKLQSTLSQVAEAVAPTVVAIRAEKRSVFPETLSRGADGREPGSAERTPTRTTRDRVVGSGVIIRSDGLILTNDHVIERAAPEDIECTLSNGDTYTVRAITSDPRSDLAILRIDAKDLPEARLGDATTVKQGHFAIVMGNPFGLAAEGKPAMSFGIISALGRHLSPQLSPQQERHYGNLIETDARINLGNSGGPLLNLRGEVIGVTTAVSSRAGGGEGVGYAIPMDRRTKAIVEQLMRGEEVEYGYLGVRLNAPRGDDRRRAGVPPGIGAVISEVEDDTPAAEANLLPGDLVLRFDGESVSSVDELIRMVGAARVGAPVALVVARGGERLTLEITPARREVLQGANYQAPVDWRGLTLADITPELRDRYAIEPQVRGVVITAIDPSVVEQVEVPLRDEIQEGMVVNQVSGTPVENLYQFKKQTAGLAGPVKISMSAQDLAINVTLAPEISSR